ncbi:unnamed protein product [Polarella glacialis]|uniref:PAC domain-containing protein n=1 Tax=Polarella glacialis TaxID=89957 RepID=A0A813HCQ9_POLGL|nr:unnamed protein product [Polarella glacialis]CAE8644500.1 unnamed protein product [Polarella glacialis]
MERSNAGIAIIYPIWAGLVLVLAFARLAHAAFRAVRGGMLSQIAKRLRLWIWGSAPVAGAAQPIDELVKVIGGVRRLERVSQGLLWMFPVLAPTLVFDLCSWVFAFGYDSPVRYNLPSSIGNGIVEILSTARFAVIVGSTFTVLTLYHPAWPTPLRLIGGHALILITCAVALAIQQDILQWYYHSLWVTIVRTGACVVHGRNGVTIADGSVFSLAMLVSVQLRWGMTIDFLMIIIFPSIFIFILSAIVEQSRKSELRATLEGKASKELETSVEAVLATICDAVVLLSDNFQLLRPSPHLAGLLLRSSCSAVLMTGGNFVELLVESDRDSCLQFMGGPHTHAKMLHAHMRDANSSAVSVHLYHTKYLDLEGQFVHIIGIREDIEENNRPQPPLQELPSSLSRQVVDEVWDRAHESSASSISGSSDPMPLVEGDHTMSRRVWVDASSTDLMMVKCTPEFTAWSGPSGLNDGLLSWVAPVDCSNFYEFFQKALHDFNHAQVPYASLKPRSMVLKLKPPHLGMSIEVEAEIVEICAGRSDGRTAGSFSEPETLGCVSFKSVPKTKTTQKRSKRTSRTGMASRHLKDTQDGYMEGLLAAASESKTARPRSKSSSSAVAASSPGRGIILKL